MASTQNATVFANTMISHVQVFINALSDLHRDHDRMVEDAELAAAAAAAMNASGRPDLTEAEFKNAGLAINAIVATYNGGNPSNKSCLYDLL